LYEPIPLYGSYTGQIIVMLEGGQEQIFILMGLFGLVGSLCLLVVVTFCEVWTGRFIVVLRSCVTTKAVEKTLSKFILHSVSEKSLTRMATILRSGIEGVVDWVVSGALWPNSRFLPASQGHVRLPTKD
jgi:hypothetical protein